METSENGGAKQTQRCKDKHRKPKPWDDDPNIDRWTIEKFDPSWNEGGMLEVTSFSTLFPQYREKYLQECWPVVKSALKEYGIVCELNLVEGSMTVSTTRKTKDLYIIVKARDLIKLLSRSVPAPQAIKILNDGMQCDIIKISSFVRRMICKTAGPTDSPQFIHFEGAQSKPDIMFDNAIALVILTGCYILVQGNTVSVMGSFKALKQVRRIVEDCMTNAMHPIFHIKTLMVRKELEKDPALAHENWDRFLPKFNKKNINQNKVKSKEKRTYTPFPPPQQPSKIDIQLETGEYFLNDKVKSAKKWQEKQEKQSEKTAKNKRKREAAFIPPKEPAVQEIKSDDGNKDLAAVATSLKKKAKEYGIQRMAENVNPEAYLAESGEPSKKKSKRKHS